MGTQKNKQCSTISNKKLKKEAVHDGNRLYVYRFSPYQLDSSFEIENKRQKRLTHFEFFEDKLCERRCLFEKIQYYRL